MLLRVAPCLEYILSCCSLTVKHFVFPFGASYVFAIDGGIVIPTAGDCNTRKRK